MNTHISDRLDAYLDDELEARQHDDMDRHLAQCASCRQALAQLQGLRAALQHAPAAPQHTSATAFWAELEPLLGHQASDRVQRPSLGLAWAWGGVLFLFAALSHAVIIALLAANLAASAGMPLGRWLPLETIRSLETGATPGVMLGSWFQHSVLGLVLQTPAGRFLPVMLLLLFTAGMALGLLGWLLAKLRQPQPTIS